MPSGLRYPTHVVVLRIDVLAQCETDSRHRFHADNTFDCEVRYVGDALVIGGQPEVCMGQSYDAFFG